MKKRLFFKKTILLVFLLLSGKNLLFSQSDKMIKDVVESQKKQNIKNSDVAFLEGRIHIQIHETTYYNPIKKGMRRVVQKQTNISTGFFGRISQSRVQLYQTKPTERIKCEPYTHCPVFNGSSKYVLQRDPNTMKITESKEYPLMVFTQFIEQDFRWVKDQEKFVITAKSEASGINTLEGLNVEIKPFKPADNTDGATLAPLQPSYVLWITAGRDWTQADDPKVNGTNLRWDDIREKLIPLDESVSLGIPYEINSPEKPERDGENSYQQLLWHDVKGFDTFLLNPWRAYGISSSGIRYYKDDYAETKVSIDVSISMGMVDELTPLENVDDIEVTPLEPLGEEIPLAPLEPIKD